jgi:uncharacterized iron-regulated membrane protein
VIRNVIFWSHLVVGLLASIVVFVLCLSGALLSFERQSIDWAERTALALPPPGAAALLPADELVASAAKVEPTRPPGVRYANDPRMPARIGFSNGSAVCVNAYTGQVLGRGPTSLRAFYNFVRRAHVALLTSPPLPSRSCRDGRISKQETAPASATAVKSGVWLARRSPASAVSQA